MKELYEETKDFTLSILREVLIITPLVVLVILVVHILDIWFK